MQHKWYFLFDLKDIPYIYFCSYTFLLYFIFDISFILTCTLRASNVSLSVISFRFRKTPSGVATTWTACTNTWTAATKKWCSLEKSKIRSKGRTGVTAWWTHLMSGGSMRSVKRSKYFEEVVCVWMIRTELFLPYLTTALLWPHSELQEQQPAVPREQGEPTAGRWRETHWTEAPSQRHYTSRSHYNEETQLSKATAILWRPKVLNWPYCYFRFAR